MTTRRSGPVGVLCLALLASTAPPRAAEDPAAPTPRPMQRPDILA
jgi:hypothetical protein